MVMQENRTGASKKTYVRPPGSTGHSGRVPEKSRGNHEGWDKQDSSVPEKSNNGKGQEKQAEQSNNGKGQDKQSEKTNNGKAKGQNKNDDDDADPQTLADLPGNSEKGLANALSHGQGNKYGIYKKLEGAGYTVDDDGDIVIGDGGSPAPAPILNGNNSRPEEHQIYYYHGDHLGSSNVLTDRFGRNYEHLENFPYGESWVEESRNQTNLPFKFTGKELDPETGLYYFGARYYDPQVSIWVSVDPVLDKYLPQGKIGSETDLPANGVFNSKNINLFHYGGNNPLSIKDPDGRFSIEVTLPSGRSDAGTLVLYNDYGVKVKEYNALGRGSNAQVNNYNHNNRTMTNADTPVGTYEIENTVKRTEGSGGYSTYGPEQIRLKGTEGEAKLAYANGRSGISIHGGDLRTNPRSDSTPGKPGRYLQYTHGCMRLSNGDIQNLNNSIQGIVENRGFIYGVRNFFLGLFGFSTKDLVKVHDE
jgi:RHS repeat-associated protein